MTSLVCPMADVAWVLNQKLKELAVMGRLWGVLCFCPLIIFLTQFFQSFLFCHFLVLVPQFYSRCNASRRDRQKTYQMLIRGGNGKNKNKSKPPNPALPKQRLMKIGMWRNNSFSARSGAETSIILIKKYFLKKRITCNLLAQKNKITLETHPPDVIWLHRNYILQKDFG